MGIFERYLSFWVALSIVLGMILGQHFVAQFTAIAALEVAHVNFVIALLIWLMIYPMMVQIDFRAVLSVGKEPQGLILTLLINWLIKPFTMAVLGVVFFKFLFADWVDPQTASEVIAGMILLGVAPCTAMVFVWSQMVKGDPNYTLVQVSVNDVVMIFAYAPIAAFLLGLTDLTVPMETLLLSVGVYVLIPLLAGLYTRQRVFHQNPEALADFAHRMKPYSVVGLLGTVVLLFGFQAEKILAQPTLMAMIAIPLILQAYGIFALSYWLAWKLRLRHAVAAPASLIGTSNFFEMAVAVAISLFGFHSPAALATVVGVLVEVPVMLSLVFLAQRSAHWFSARGEKSDLSDAHR